MNQKKIMGIVALMLFPLSGSLYGQEAGGAKDSVEQIGTNKLRYVSPIDFPISLAGNFGEPRPNHFHCGIDVRTQGVIGKKIFSVADGYVSRLTVGMNGFGNAVYVTHPDGITSVYAHLDRFMPKMAERVLRKQYETESEVVDLRLSPEEFPVKAGEQIAFSGNTGASMGPHLHLEFQRTADRALVNPLPYFQHLIRDTMRPKVHQLRLYAKPGEGVLLGTAGAVSFVPGTNQKVYEAWGRIGVAYWADDYMNGTANKFGIYDVRLFVDDQEVFRSVIDGYMPSDNRKVNSWGDYGLFTKQKRWYLKSFAEPGNDLKMLSYGPERGWVDICEARDYRFRYEFRDQYGNLTTCAFRVRGVPSEERLAQEALKMQEQRQSKNFMHWNGAGVIQFPGMELRIPAGALFRDVELHPKIKIMEEGYSNVYTLHDEPEPLLVNATLMLAPRTEVADPEKWYIESSKGYLGGEWQDGWLVASVRYLNESYGLARDTIQPVITPLSAAKWANTRRMRVRVTDKGSGLRTFKAYLDGQFVLFTGGVVKTCDLRDAPVRREKRRRLLELVATDRCGNERRDSCYFVY